MKIVHCADIHFDSPFSELSASKAEIRKSEIRQTFSKIIKLVKEEKADCLVIAGDLFDGENVSKMTLDFIISEFSKICDVKVLIAAGNHDPKGIKSFYNLLDWGENVHIFDTKPELIEVCGKKILGVSFDKAVCDEPILTDEDLKLFDQPDIIVMHSNLSGSGYNPVSKDFVAKTNAKLFLSGHIHKSYTEKISNTVFSYPGCMEGRGFDELGKKGVMIYEILGDDANVSFVPLSAREYSEITVDVSGAVSIEQIIGSILLENSFCKDFLYKIKLVGECDFVIDKDVLTEALSPFFIKIKDDTRQKLDLTDISENYTVMGLFVKKMLEKIEKEGETEELKNALRFGLAAIRGEKVKP